MNKTISVSEVSEPPLLMLFLAAISLVFNLCFPQFSVSASSESRKFIHDDSLEKNAIAMNNIKKSLETKEKDQNKQVVAVKQSTQEVYSQLSLEPKKTVTKKTVKTASTKPNATTAISGSSTSKWVTVTAYSSTVDQCDANPFITASGTRVRDGIIATNLLAFGTKVKFPSLYGDKIFVVEDRMNKRFSDRADIWFETREQAKQFGVKQLEMVIVS